MNFSVDESAGTKLKTLPAVELVSPMMMNIMDLTPEINALAYGWKADSYEFDSLKLTSGQRFHEGKTEAMLGDLLAGLLAGAVPAWRGAHLAPVEALRHE